MKKGVVLIAHNNRKVDYAKMAIVSGGLAKKHLAVPVSLITDKSTLDWMKESGSYDDAESVFENIILTDRPEIDNYRNLNDGLERDKIPFINSTRSMVWELTPYDRTLLIDSDFLICSSALNHYWEIDSSILIGDSFTDIEGSRIGVLDKWVADTGVHLYWATTVMFTKNQTSKVFFDLVSYIKENYSYYADLFRFDSQQYRNDISFSIAKHILDGFEKSSITLPSILTVQDKDILVGIERETLKVLISETNDPSKYVLCSVKNQDIHVMNKQSIIRLYDNFKEIS